MKAGKVKREELIFLLGLVFFCSLISPVPACSQVKITGMVRDEISQHPLYLATVLDKRTGEATLTDSTGFYQMAVESGDTLSYSFIGYHTRFYVIPFRLGRVNHDVFLLPRSQRLSEIEIKALTPYQRDSLERIETFGNYLNSPATHFISMDAHNLRQKPNPNYNDAFGIELNPFGFFSKAGKEKRRFDRMYPKFEKEQYVNSRYTPELVHQLTGLTGDSLALFLYKFRPSYELARTASDLVFWSWIKIQYRSWIEKKR